jgi:hypothetical protein
MIGKIMQIMDNLRSSLSAPAKSVLADLERYNEDELFYRRCYELQIFHPEMSAPQGMPVPSGTNGTTVLETYVRSYGVNDLLRWRLTIPPDIYPELENAGGLILDPKTLPWKMTERYAFEVELFQDRVFYLKKHNRIIYAF